LRTEEIAVLGFINLWVPTSSRSLSLRALLPVKTTDPEAISETLPLIPLVQEE
jgi:hypothetical protein